MLLLLPVPPASPDSPPDLVLLAQQGSSFPEAVPPARPLRAGIRPLRPTVTSQEPDSLSLQQEGRRPELPGQTPEEEDMAPFADPVSGSAPETAPAAPPKPEVSRSLADLTQGDFAETGEPQAPSGKPPRRPVSLRLQAAAPGVSLSGGNASDIAPGYGQGVVQSDPAHPGENVSGDTQMYNSGRAPVFPISFGISAAIPFAARWTLTAGLDYTQRAGARSVAEPGGPARVQNVTLHYLGLPVDVHYYINPESRLRVYFGAGLKMEKCIHVTGAGPLQDPWLFSAGLHAGADLRILPGVRLFLAPSVTQYLNRSAYTASWDDAPYFSLHAGLSFDLK